MSSIKNLLIQSSQLFFSKFSLSTPINTLWEEFKSICSDCLSLVPTKFSNTAAKQPWITTHIKRLSRKKQRLYNLARASNCPIKWKSYRNFKKEVQHKCREAYHRYITSLIDSTGSITKRLWTYIKKQRNDNCGVASLKHEGNIHNDSLTKAQLLNKYFTSVFTSSTAATFPPLNEPPLPDITTLSIDTRGVLTLLQNLQVHKASGPDEIPARLLKEFSEEFATLLTFLFQTSIQQSLVPLDWKHANIMPTFKKGDRSLCSNYRPVSLTCICSKILEHIVYSHISSHLSQYSILCNEQHGFRSARSCETQLLLTVNDFSETLNNNGQTDAILLDFSKAFDRVSHQHLYYKLNHYGIRGKILDWLKQFLTGRSQCVIINGEQSDSTTVTSGVPQGTVLAPLLFLCFINDLPNNILSTVRLYADDVILYTAINTVEDCNKLQHDLNTLVRWAEDWKMSFNLQKCEFLRITLKKNPIAVQYTLHDYTIHEVTHAKYLGVVIDSKLSWSEHIKQVTNKANKVKGFLQRNLYNCPISIKTNCYKSMIKPIVEYACTIWAPHTQKDIAAIESVQRRAARFVCNNYSSFTSVNALLSYLQWPTLEHCRNQLKALTMFKIVHNLIDVPSNTLLKPATSDHYTRGHTAKFQRPFTRVDSYRYSFIPSAIKIWNSLPQDLINCTNINLFKQKLASLESI